MSGHTPWGEMTHKRTWPLSRRERTALWLRLNVWQWFQ